MIRLIKTRERSNNSRQHSPAILLLFMIVGCMFITGCYGADQSNEKILTGHDNSSVRSDTTSPPQPESSPMKGILLRNSFSEGKTFDDLFTHKMKDPWHRYNRTRKNNWLELSREQAHKGHQSLKMFAEGTRGGKLSKSSIIRDGFFFKQGQRVKISTWFFIPSGQSLKHITLLDLECTTCWSKFNLFANQSPGVRLQISDDSGVIYVERGKIGYRNKSFTQSRGQEVSLPKDRWTRIDWVLDLAIGDAGLTEVFIDGELIISGRGTNMPDPAVFLKVGVILNKPTRYDNIEFGISANSQPTDVLIYMDDIIVTAE